MIRFLMISAIVFGLFSCASSHKATETGWSVKGFEAQVNNSHADWRRTGSLYGIQGVKDVFVKDNEWYDMYIRVNGKKITIQLNDKIVNEYTESENAQLTKVNEERLISSGTFALQGNDPNSKVLYKEVLLRVN
jgi:hypothetical protein